MAITINGSGTVTGISVGGLPDGIVDDGTLATDAVTNVKIADNAVDLAEMASGTDGQIITYDASGNPTAVGPGTDGQVLTSTGAGSPPAFETAAGGGKVLQVVQSVKTDTYSMTSATYANVTGLSATITPSATSSKILIFINISMGSTSYTGLLKVRKGSTDLLVGDSAGSRLTTTAVISPGDTDAVRRNEMIPVTYLDSPSTTSATTYNASIAARDAGQTIYVNRSSNDNNGTAFDFRTTSTITVMEIGA